MRENNTSLENNIVVDGKHPHKTNKLQSLFGKKYSKLSMWVLVFAVIGGLSSWFVLADTTTYSLWSTSTVPATLTAFDRNSIEVGVKFEANVAGEVTGVRFYKGAQNTGTHVGTLWSNTGTQLASVTFTNETPSGWQTAYFAQPVQIAANVTYVVSYFAPKGHYSVNTRYFTKNYTNGPLTAPAKGNGVFIYSNKMRFPTLTHDSSNYWVDVLFNTKTFTQTVAPAPPASVSAVQDGTSIDVSWTAAQSSNPISNYDIYRNGSLLTQVGGATLSYSDSSNLVGGTTYSYQIETIDNTNAVSAASPTATVTYNVSPTPAPVTTSPPPTTTTSSGSGSLPETFYGAFSNGVPTSSSFFPIAFWDQTPSGGNVPSPYTNQAQAIKAIGGNIFVGLYGWPEAYGSDNGELAAAKAEGMYVIGGGDPTSTTDAASVNSVKALINSVSGSSSYDVGYQWTDEPACTENVVSEVATIHSEDSTRMTYANEGAWTAWYVMEPGVLGASSCLTESEANLNAPDITSSDEYALTDPWHIDLCAEAQHVTIPDCLWVYGMTVANERTLVGPNKPVWQFVETGSDDLGLSSQNGNTCNSTTNICTPIGNEYRATPTQVNSAAWMTLINGANGIEWFCDDTIAYDYCAGGGSNGNPTVDDNPAIPSNLTYIDNTVESYAPELNTASSGYCTMQNPDGDTTTTCSGGNLSLSTSDSSVPIVGMDKEVGSDTYLFVEDDRDGSTSGTFGLGSSFSGDTATLVYDSNAQYNSSASEQGKTFTLDSNGSFSDTLPANYSVHIYKITSS